MASRERCYVRSDLTRTRQQNSTERSVDRDLTTNSREPRRNLVKVPLPSDNYHRPKTFQSRNKFRIVFRGNVTLHVSPPPLASHRCLRV